MIFPLIQYYTLLFPKEIAYFLGRNILSSRREKIALSARQKIITKLFEKHLHAGKYTILSDKSQIL